MNLLKATTCRSNDKVGYCKMTSIHCWAA